MKTALLILLVVLGTVSGLIAFAALAGLISPAALLTSDVAFLLYASVGAMLVGFNDDGVRRSITLRGRAVPCC
jgi:hypothetical protein